MRIVLYEFVTGGGWFAIDPQAPPSDSLLAEGAAMRSALAEDLVAAGCEVEVLHDERLPRGSLTAGVSIGNVYDRCKTDVAFQNAVERSEAVILIAPEFDGHLLRLARQVEQVRKPLLSPGGAFVEVASNKLATSEALIRTGVKTPRSWKANRMGLPPLAYPFVCKPVDGCGSENVRLITSDDDVAWRREGMLVQEYCPGMAASVAVLCGPQGKYPLRACTQRLSHEKGRFAYEGGECPLSLALETRATELSIRAIDALPVAVGYIGVDLVLGEAEDGSQDCVIEVNPRLTTSYVGLRALSTTNLAQAMLEVAHGREPQLAWRNARVRFSAEGAVECSGL
jgi:predicted ATP-grasp superfamily ATP-dependent carboligase